MRQPDADKQNWDAPVASLLDETGDAAVRTSQAFDNAALSVTCWPIHAQEAS